MLSAVTFVPDDPPLELLAGGGDFVPALDVVSSGAGLRPSLGACTLLEGEEAGGAPLPALLASGGKDPPVFRGVEQRSGRRA